MTTVLLALAVFCYVWHLVTAIELWSDYLDARRDVDDVDTAERLHWALLITVLLPFAPMVVPVSFVVGLVCWRLQVRRARGHKEV